MLSISTLVPITAVIALATALRLRAACTNRGAEEGIAAQKKASYPEAPNFWISRCLPVPPRTTFLDGVSSKAKGEYKQLTKRKDLSRNELKNMLRKWGKDHEVQDKVDAYLIEMDKYDKVVHDKFVAVLERLPKLSKEFLDLKENQDLSREQANYKLQIMRSENYLEYKMLSYIWKKLRKGEDKPKKGSRKSKVTKKGLKGITKKPVT